MGYQRCAQRGTCGQRVDALALLGLLLVFSGCKARPPLDVGEVAGPPGTLASFYLDPADYDGDINAANAGFLVYRPDGLLVFFQLESAGEALTSGDAESLLQSSMAGVHDVSNRRVETQVTALKVLDGVGYYSVLRADVQVPDIPAAAVSGHVVKDARLVYFIGQKGSIRCGGMIPVPQGPPDLAIAQAEILLAALQKRPDAHDFHQPNDPHESSGHRH